jgi:hypothetical protein
VCHALLEAPKFSALLLRIDHELAEQTRSEGCRCGGALHRADYPRKPRGCPRHLRPDYSSRLSFCCAQCRKRSTSKSVRFLGRRVYLALAVVLGQALGVARRTLQRWRRWWRDQFPLTPLWRAACARFEIPARLRHLSEVHLRYARWDFSRVDLVDPRTGAILCPIKPLDKAANADGKRRRLDPVTTDLSPLPPTGMAPLLRELLAEYAATGMPPAYLPTTEPTPSTPTPSTPIDTDLQ